MLSIGSPSQHPFPSAPSNYLVYINSRRLILKTATHRIELITALPPMSPYCQRDSNFMQASCSLQSELRPDFWGWLPLAGLHPFVPAIVAVGQYMSSGARVSPNLASAAHKFRHAMQGSWSKWWLWAGVSPQEWALATGTSPTSSGYTRGCKIWELKIIQCRLR